MIKNIKTLFSSKKHDEARSIISEIEQLGDRLFTSDEERAEFALKVQKLYAFHDHWFVAGGRPALAWSMSLVMVYQLILRDILIMSLTGQIPDGMSHSALMSMAIKFFMGF